MRRVVSSEWTPFYKFIFPVVWTGVICGIGLSEGLWVLWFVAPIVIVGMAVWYVFAGRLKAVQIDDSALYVSNYLKQIRIPLSEVSKITENTLINIRPVTVHLSTRSGFGKRITFIPRARLTLVFDSHPVVEELSQLVAQTKGNNQPRARQ